MNHPEALLLPAFMLADYQLTVLGAVWRERGHAAHFKSRHYELNPLWQAPIQRKQRFNLRHTLLTLLLSGLLLYLVESGSAPALVREGMTGCVLTVYAAILGRHLSNLLIFDRLARKPEEISGEVVMAHSLLLFLSISQTWMVLLPVGLIAIATRSPFAAGGAIGLCLFVAVQMAWRVIGPRHAASRPAAPAQP